MAGFGGDKEVTKDTYCDKEGEQNHGCNGQTNQSAEAGGGEGREGKGKKGKGRVNNHPSKENVGEEMGRK